MLKRIYIDNYKCCVNLDVKFDSINLLLGDNGAGKSTVFEVLLKLQSLVSRGGKVSTFFPARNLTRWQKTNKQRFELELDGNGGTYNYKLELIHETSQPSRIYQESLSFDKNILIDFIDDEVQLYLDDGSTDTKYPSRSDNSVITALPDRRSNPKIIWFKERLNKFIIVRIDPMQIRHESGEESAFLDKYSRNFVDWYRQVSQNQGKIFQITNALQEVIDGFKYFEFEKSGKDRQLLKVQIGNSSYQFHELSDGQRVLIILYALIYFARNHEYTLFIDEPGNFVSLPEIQPWLSTLYDFCTDGELQSIIISHHPEYINYLAGSVGLWFERKQDAPVRVTAVSDENNFDIAELVARGWLHE